MAAAFAPVLVEDADVDAVLLSPKNDFFLWCGAVAAVAVAVVVALIAVPLASMPKKPPCKLEVCT